MKQHYTNIRTRKLFILLLATLCLAACVEQDPRVPVSTAVGPSNLYKIEMWSAHKQYEFGELVHLRATLTNQSTEKLAAKLDFYPIINIVVGTKNPSETTAERVWSQEHPDEALYELALAPGESYVIEWSFTLSRRDRYSADVCTSGHSTGLTKGSRDCYGVTIYYGIEVPQHPMP